jgi:hypothetical protein
MFALDISLPCLLFPYFFNLIVQESSEPFFQLLPFNCLVLSASLSRIVRDYKMS